MNTCQRAPGVSGHVCDLAWHHSCSSVSCYCHCINRGRMTLPSHLPSQEIFHRSALCLTFHCLKGLGISPWGDYLVDTTGLISHTCCSYPGRVGMAL